MSSPTYKTSSHMANVIAKSAFEVLKSLVSGAATLTAFVFAPIWNHPDRMKRVTRWLYMLFGILVLLWFAFWLGQRPVFTIKKIQIESSSDMPLKHVNLPVVRSLVIGNLTGNFFSTRLNSARETFETVPWVRHASVRRVWPNGLDASIEEHQVFGIWGGSNEPTLVNTYGELFTANVAEAEADKNLIVFNGPKESSKDVMALYLQINKWFKPWNAKAVEVNLSSRYAWSAKLDNGMRFEFGRDTDNEDRSQIEMRVQRFLKVWPQLADKLTGKIDCVDLRYSNGFAIRLNGNRNDSPKLQVANAGPVPINVESQHPKKIAISAKTVGDDTHPKKADKKNAMLSEKNGRKN